MLEQLKVSSKLVLLLALFSLLTLVLAACGDSTATTAPTVTTLATTTSVTTNIAPATTAAIATTTATSASGEVVVYAAASLTDSFNEVKTELEKANPGLKITYSFAGSNQLRTQLEQGAKADVFASADQTQMDAALKANLVADKGMVFVRNRLVVILPKSNPGKVTKLQDLANPGLKFITAQESVPVGNYTLQALDKLSKDPGYGADFGDKVKANFKSKEDNVKQIVSKIQLGEGDAGIVYISDVTPKASPDITTLEIPDPFNTIATYPIAPLKAATNPVGAKLFIDYVLSDKAQAIFKKNNFVPVTATAKGGPSSSFELTGLVSKASQIKLDDLKTLPKTSVTTSPQTSNGPLGQASYAGPLLYDLLQKAEVKTDSNRKNDILRKLVVVTGSDGYSVALAWGELDPKYAAKKVILAYEQDDKPIPDKDGFARLVVPGDGAQGRFVSNLVKLEVVDAK